MKKIDVMTSASELAAWLGIGVPAVAAYARKAIVVRGEKRGEYDLKKSVKAYIGHMRLAAENRADDLTARERVRLLRIQADAAEAKAKKLAGGYLKAARVERRWTETRRRVLKILGEIPEEVGRRLPSLTARDLGEIKNEVDLATAPLKDEKATDD